MLMAFTYLPGFVTLVFRGMPTVWRGRHRPCGFHDSFRVRLITFDLRR